MATTTGVGVTFGPVVRVIENNIVVFYNYIFYYTQGVNNK